MEELRFTVNKWSMFLLYFCVASARVYPRLLVLYYSSVSKHVVSKFVTGHISVSILSKDRNNICISFLFLLTPDKQSQL